MEAKEFPNHLSPHDALQWMRKQREVVSYRFQSSTLGNYATLPEQIHPSLKNTLQTMGITQLYSHQELTFHHVHQGKHVVVVTPTASGKTLCYNLPVLNSMLSDENARALYLFPTKALSNDQMNELHTIITALNKEIRVHTFDGDTPSDARKAIRKMGNIVITNPDMLHQGILPHHTKWAKLFTNLQYIVIDELHSYRGVFGSNLANVIRRLKRICSFYGSNVQFICSSATIANPQELAQQICGEDITVVDNNGAPQGDKYFFIYNPPVVNPELGIRASYLKRARTIALKFLQAGQQTIIFTRSRLNVERLTRDLKAIFQKLAKPPEQIQGYRGGYLPTLRREIEKGLRNDKIKGVISTNALELGIDIGSLDVCVIAGYPGTVASTWQQAGRVGRTGSTSISVMVTSSNPLDQYIAQNPDFFFESPVEAARINPDNLIILLSHIKCAAFELPFNKDEQFGNLSIAECNEILTYLTENGILHHADDRYHWVTDSYPANEISLRTMSEGNFAVIDTTDKKERVIGEVDYHSAPETIHQKAIYMVAGEQYQVHHLDWDGRKAYVEKATTDYYTDAMTYSKVTVLDVFSNHVENNIAFEHGEVRINKEIVGFKKIKFDTSENVGYDDISLPEQEMHTTSFWFTIPESILHELELNRTTLVEGIIGVGFALHTVASVLCMCDPRDIDRSVGDKSANWFAIQPDSSRGSYTSLNPAVNHSINVADAFDPTLFIYDNYPGGIGFSQFLYEHHAQLLQNSYKLLQECSCQYGCPACVGPVFESGKHAKHLALKILQRLLPQS